MSSLMLASNPWGPALVTLAALALIAIPVLALTSRYRAVARRRLAATRDESARNALTQGLDDAWAVTAKTVLVATVAAVLAMVTPVVTTQKWGVGIATLLAAGLVAWWWFDRATRAREREHNLSPEEA